MRIDGSNYVVHEETLLKRFCDLRKFTDVIFLIVPQKKLFFTRGFPSDALFLTWPYSTPWISKSVIAIRSLSDIDTFQWNKTTLGFYYRSWEIILISLKNFNIFYFSRHLIYLELDPQLYYTRFDIFTLFGNYKRFNRLHTGNAIILIAMHLELRNVHWKWISITLISNKSRMTNELLLYVT